MMQGLSNPSADRPQTDAADWVVRLRAPEVGEADWLAFEDWLCAAPDNRARFDAAEALWAEVDARAGDLMDLLAETPKPGFKARRLSWSAPLVGVLAAAAFLALLAPYAAGVFARPTVYTTAKGEHSTLQLADGSRVDLNGGSSISVRIDRNRREVVMNDAEAAFDVTHDPARPFIIHVGDRSVRVVGTQFDVSHRGGMISVTVRRGVVRVASISGGDAVALTPGQQLRHHEGDGGSSIDTVSADDVFAWRQGRLIYRDRPLADVVADLNHDFQTPIRIEGDQLAALRFSGVLTVDTESATLQRLTALLPLSATSSEGVIVLRSRDSTR